MNRYEREHPDNGTARMAVNRAINTRMVPNTWQRFEALNQAAHELRRALWGIDGKNAWCGERNVRISRYILACRAYDAPRLP